MRIPHVVADVDTGIDDALALIYLAHLYKQREIDLTVTTSAGNCTAQDAAANSMEVLRCCGVSLSTPIVPGAASPREVKLTTTPETHGPFGLGYWTAHRADHTQHRADQDQHGTDQDQRSSAQRGRVADHTQHRADQDQHGTDQDQRSSAQRGCVTDHTQHSAEARQKKCGELVGSSEGFPGWDGTAQLAIAQWKKANPDYLLVAGPATNIAYAIEHAPEVLEDCTVVFMAGAFDYPGNTTATAEWNAWVDPHALRYALENWPNTAKPPLMCPLNQTERVLLYPDMLARWQRALGQDVQGRNTPEQRAQGQRALGQDAQEARGLETDALAQRISESDVDGQRVSQHPSELAQLMGDALRFYFEFHDSVGVGYCAQIHDLAAAQVMLGKVNYRSNTFDVFVETEGELRGTTMKRDRRDDQAVRGVVEVLEALESESVFREFERIILP
ncbi:nucleoside hydrolase [Corynebacterium auriscanis]|uniref:nucleoside hydrolase n=1 Tax=Corynebacterium auriscanis TaxID=99807 RepID=UPI003CEF268C